MNQLVRGLAALVWLMLLLAVWPPQPGQTQSTPGGHITIVAETADSVTIQFTAVDLHLAPVMRQGETFQQVTLPDAGFTTAPGAPQLPVATGLLAVPATTGLSVDVLEADIETMTGVWPVPVPAAKISGDAPATRSVTETFSPDPAIYRADEFFPKMTVQLGQPALLRNQSVVPVRFFPVQVNPAAGTLKFYRRIVARLRWPLAVAVSNNSPPVNSAFEPILKNALLNYQPAPKSGPQQAASTTVPRHRPTGSAPPALKIGVKKDGVVRLTGAELTAAGFDLAGVDPRYLTLTSHGANIPRRIEGESDGMFDSTDALIFYGTALTGVYTAENIYWLTTGQLPGLRLPIRLATPDGGAPVPGHFPKTLHAELDTFYWQTMPHSAGQDHWFWGDRLTAPQNRNYQLGLSFISSSASTATLRLALKGYTNTPHHSRLWLNGQPVSNQTWAGQSKFEQTAVVSHSLLVDGYNVVTVEALTTTAPVDQWLVNWIDIDYQDTYTASNNLLRFRAPTSGTFQFNVTNFSTPDVAVFDVTTPTEPVLITGTRAITGGNTVAIQFEDSAATNSRYLALTPARYNAPASLALDRPSTWRSPDNGADYIIITHRNFFTAAQQLAEYRRQQGLRVVTVDVADIYDEFNFGIFGPSPIRDFLQYAYTHWQPPAPAYVLLVGDAYQDYKDNLHTGTINYVPAPIVLTDILGETPSDNWYAQISGDDVLPDLMIGRLSVQTVAQAQTVIDKIIQYEALPTGQTWQRQMLLVADDDSTAFKHLSEQLAGRLPTSFTARRVYADDYPPGDPTADIIEAFNSGIVLVNYSGHGSINRWGRWANGNIFQQVDVASLTNGPKLPFVTIANCLNGFFPHTGDTESFAETLHRFDAGGAVGVWASTGLDYPSAHQELMDQFYRTLFQDGVRRLGTATTTAKLNAFAQNDQYSELVQTFVLFGDPATVLKIPPDSEPGNATVYLPIITKFR